MKTIVHLFKLGAVMIKALATGAAVFLSSLAFTPSARAAGEADRGAPAQLEAATFAFYGGLLLPVPGGSAAFADRVVLALRPGEAKDGGEPADALGPPDSKVRFDRGAYSLGCSGQLVLAFDDVPISDGPGVDLIFAEVGDAREFAELSVSQNGESWVLLGRTTGGIEQLDLSGLVSPGTEFRYLRIRDLSAQCYGTMQGADLDAVAAVYHPPEPPPPPKPEPVTVAPPEPPPPAPAPMPEKIILSGEVLFDFGKAELKEEGRRVVVELAAKLSTGHFTVAVEGHSDSVGGDEANERISLARARAVADLLVEQGKLPVDSVHAAGLGKNKPRGDNSTPEGRALNRRVEITVTPLTN